jgi:hypothetical protein
MIKQFLHHDSGWTINNQPHRAFFVVFTQINYRMIEKTVYQRGHGDEKMMFK